MSERCADIRTELVAHFRGELGPLPALRVDAHLRHCTLCRAVSQDLTGGLDAIRNEAPGAGTSIDVLAVRVAARHPSRSALTAPGWAAASLGFVSLLAIAVLGVRGAEQVGERSAIADGASPARMAPADERDAPHEPAATTSMSTRGPSVITRDAPAPEVRMLSGATFAGVIDRGSERIVVEQRAGFAVFAFHALEPAAQGSVDVSDTLRPARSLEVRANGVTIHVVGTLFFVDVSDGITRIGVERGAVVVTAEGERRTVSAGERIAFDAHGPVPVVAGEAERFLVDPELVAFHDGTASVADRIVEAEQLASGGRPSDARAHLVAGVRDPAFARSHDLLRYEIARLDGLVLGDRVRARAALRELAVDARPSLRVQAALTTCELELAVDRCAARACLSALRAGGGPVGEEAARLAQRLPAGAPACP